MRTYTYLFFLGREPMLSEAEIKAVLAALKIDYETDKLSDRHLVITAQTEISPPQIMSRLGGTIKISQEIELPKKDTAEALAEFLNKKIPSGKINFSIITTDRNLWLKIKNILKTLGRNVRFIEPKNTATIIHNNLIKKGADIEMIGERCFLTVAVQPIEQLGERDFGRPGRDDLSGMLPPKLAMMMINLAQAELNSTILDPFCGSGTIITEAALMGYKNIIGTDISDKAVADTNKNIEWMKWKNKIEHAKTVRAFQCDVEKLSNSIGKNSVGYIVTEPYLGRPMKGNETRDFILRQIKELSALYIKAFEQFNKILQINGTVIFIIPCFNFKNEWIKINIIEQLKKIGFEAEELLHDKNHLLYWRPGQKVGREIWKFKLQG